MKADIKLTITRLTPVKVNTLLGAVASGMDGNAAFPDPEVPIADMRALHIRLTHAVTEAIDGSKHSKYLRDAIVDEARDMLRKQANYVRLKANCEAAVLSSSGFEMQRERQRIGQPQTPEVKLATPVHSGTMKLRWNRVRGAKAYKVFIRKRVTDPAELVTVTTSASHIISGLESFQAYFVQVSAIGVAGESRMSSEVMGRAA